MANEKLVTLDNLSTFKTKLVELTEGRYVRFDTNAQSLTSNQKAYARTNIGAVEANSAITGATKCKITYDAKGLVTAGADLAASDIPQFLATAKLLSTGIAKGKAIVADGNGGVVFGDGGIKDIGNFTGNTVAEVLSANSDDGNSLNAIGSITVGGGSNTTYHKILLKISGSSSSREVIMFDLSSGLIHKASGSDIDSKLLASQIYGNDSYYVDTFVTRFVENANNNKVLYSNSNLTQWRSLSDILPSNVVLTDNSQSITGTKTFTKIVSNTIYPVSNQGAGHLGSALTSNSNIMDVWNSVSAQTAYLTKIVRFTTSNGNVTGLYEQTLQNKEGTIALTSDIPTTVSELTNDSKYISYASDAPALTTEEKAQARTNIGAGTITQVKANSVSKGTSGVISLVTADFITKDSDIATNDRYVRFDTSSQGLSDTNKGNARTNLGLGSAAVKNATSSVTQNSNDLVTSGAVWTAIDNLPEPMLFKGSLGTGGTITSLPAAAAANEGFVYKVITAGTYASKAAKVGDTFISTGSAWELIPSGDEPSGTVTSVGLSAPTGFSVSGSPVTSSGTLTLSFASGYSLPTTSKQDNWDAHSSWTTASTAEVEALFA